MGFKKYLPAIFLLVYSYGYAQPTKDTYDANGNITKDLNKDIGTAAVTGIVYNHLNLPSTISFRDKNGGNKGTINYVYDAKGGKLKKIIKEQNFPDKVILYLNGLTLKMIHFNS